MKIQIKKTKHSKTYYPQLIGKTFNNCYLINDFIKIPCQKNEGGQCMITQEDCIILENDAILDELDKIKTNLSIITNSENMILRTDIAKSILLIKESIKTIETLRYDQRRKEMV